MASKDGVLEKLRELMVQHNVSAYIVPSEDEHQSEYIAHYAQRREFLSNFSGSAGTAVITLKSAALWTDGRYHLQADQQLSPREDWILMKAGLPDTPTQEKWLCSELDPSSSIGVDEALLRERFKNISKKEFASKNLQLVPISQNLVDQVWGEEQPAWPCNPVIVHPLIRSGKSSLQKLNELREHMKEENAELTVICALDEIAWLLNIRGSDIPNQSVTISYLLVTPSSVTWFIHEKKLNDEVREHIKEANVNVEPYNIFFDSLKNYKFCSSSPSVLVHDLRCSAAVYSTLREHDQVDLIQSDFVGEAKSIKNETELSGMRQCHIRDAVAVVTFFSWLENEVLKNPSPSLTEFSVSEKLAELRASQDMFFSLSFDTIAGSGSNGAIIHYAPKKGTSAVIDANKMFLCDSGGQYLDGTTDITRTVHFGTPTDYEKKCNTLVLKGHIALDQAIFPPGTTGYKLDLLARQHLWQYGLDYRHGTGHGVGAFLNVHEGPHGISYRPNPFPLKAGMTVTIEPGYYEEGQFGIRIENVVLITEKKTPHLMTDTPYLGFENITVAPIQTKLVDLSLMNQSEIKWLNDHNVMCYKTLSPLIKDENVLQWLKRECAPI